MADYVAERVLQSTSACPDLFSSGAALQIVEAVNLALGDDETLERLFGNECLANGFLANALLELQALQLRTRSSYDAGLAASPSAERNQRVENASALEAARAARLSPATQKLRFEIANPTEQAISGALLRMYEDGSPNGQLSPLELPARARRVLEGDPSAAAPFYLERDASTATNEIHHVVFQIEQAGAPPATDSDRSFAGYDYYVFDPSQVICPVKTPPVAPQAEAPAP